MKYQDLAKRKTSLPDAPGVYFFYGPRRNVLYIGRATSLRDRAESYFTGDVGAARSPWIAEMVRHARSVGWEETDSVLESVLLEAQLIKKYQPPYNTEGKDDKSFNYLMIVGGEEEPHAPSFPRVLVVRGRDLLKKKFSERESKYLFGPFPSGGVLKEALKIVRKIFPFRDTCTPRSGRPCFNRQLGLCPGVCTGEITTREYARTIRNITLLFEGKKKALMKKLEREMQAYAKKQEFEKAAAVKRTIFALNHIQDVALLKTPAVYDSAGNGSTAERLSRCRRVEGYDVAHIGGSAPVGVMVVIEDGEPKKSDYRKFRIQNEKRGSDTDALKEILRRRLARAEPAALGGGVWPLPDLMVIDGGKAQHRVAQTVLQEYGYQIPVVSVVKNERHRPRAILGNARLRTAHEADILLANAEAHRFALSYHRKRRMIQ